MIDDPEEEAWQELEAKLKRANELAKYRLKLLVQIPENKPWVSLTNDEIAQVVGSPIDEVYLSDFRNVEAKLKERNNG